ncbi:2853_t:CDS:2, partial [Acaulospora colombiana]
MRLNGPLTVDTPSKLEAIASNYTRVLRARHVVTNGAETPNYGSFGKSWMIWAPLVSISTVFLASTASAEYRANLRHAVDTSGDDGKVHQKETIEEVEGSWTQPLASLFGLDAPTE